MGSNLPHGQYFWQELQYQVLNLHVRLCVNLKQYHPALLGGL